MSEQKPAARLGGAWQGSARHDNLPVHPDADVFELDQRRAKAYAESGYWPDSSKIAQALVKIEAGRSLGLPALMAMSEIHVIDGKPGLGAGANAALVKAHPRYDYRVDELTPERCAISFYERGQRIGVSTFTIDDAKQAKLLNRGNWVGYPRNMLFARAMTNGVGWFCPDVTAGKIYTPEELGADDYEVPAVPDDAEYADYGTDPPFDPNVGDDDDIPWPEPLEEPADTAAELQILNELGELADDE